DPVGIGMVTTACKKAGGQLIAIVAVCTEFCIVLIVHFHRLCQCMRCDQRIAVCILIYRPLLPLDTVLSVNKVQAGVPVSFTTAVVEQSCIGTVVVKILI